MKRLIARAVIAIASSTLLVSAAHAHNLIPGKVADNAVLLQGATLHTVTQGVLTDQDLLMEGGKIIAIGSNLELPANTQVMDLSGKHVYPGLIALDTTLGLIELSAVRATDDLNEVGDITPEVLGHHAFNADSEIIPTVRYMGITHAEVVPQGNGIRGRSSLMHLDGWHWQDALEQGPVAMHVTWPRAGLNTAWWEQRSPAEQRRANAAAREQLKTVFETARAYHHARRAGVHQLVDQRWEAMRGLFEGELKLFVHANDRRQIEQVLEFNREYGFDLTIVGGRDSWMLAETLAEAEIAVVFGALFGLPSRQDEAYDVAFSTPAQLHEAGVEFALAYPGFWDTRNLAFGVGNAIASGLDYQAALASVTLVPATLMGVEDRMGSLEVGKQATLVVSSGDIFDPIGQAIEYMFIDGRAVDLDNRHRQLYEKYRQRLNP